MEQVKNFAITSSDMKRLEQLYFETYQKDPCFLMNNAGLELARIVTNQNPSSIVVVCGKGNNGGDGYAAAYHLIMRGLKVNVISSGYPKTAESIYFKNLYESIGGKVMSIDKLNLKIIKSSDCIIDAIFGYGFRGEPYGIELLLIKEINQRKNSTFVISADIPSGCNADFAEYTYAVRADMTVVFGFLKAANISYPAYELCGEVVLADIGLPKRIVDEAKKSIYIKILTDTSILDIKPSRNENTHKGSFGTLAIYCGSENMIGAARLASIGALKSGVGLLKIVGDKNTLDYLKPSLSEPVYEYISDRLTDADAYTIGCGFGRDRDFLLKSMLLQAKNALCIDADGINFVADNIYILNKLSASKVLTPHPAEMARLIGSNTTNVQSQRIRLASSFAKEHNCVIVLKGARTIIASPKEIYINTSGTSALAKGGSGDVLAGMIGSYLARGLEPSKAAALAVFLHGKAGEVDNEGKDSLLPSELL